MVGLNCLIGLVGILFFLSVVSRCCITAAYLVQLKGKTREVIKFEGDMIVIERYTRSKTSCLKAIKDGCWLDCNGQNT